MFKLICFLNFNHILSIVSIEEGEGTDYRCVRVCKCGKNKLIGNWTDDNHELGYEKS